MFNKFKLFGMVALLAAAMLMVSCSKEDKIVGKWKITHASGLIGDNNDASDCKGDTWTFKANGSCSMTFWGDDYDGEWSLSKDCLSIEFMADTREKMVGEFDVDELSSSEMSLSGKWIWTRYYNDGGRESETWKVNYDFEKK